MHETLPHDAHGAQEITLPNLYERDWRAVEMNAQGQVASITSPDGVVTSYGYNARRQRTRKERQGVVTHYSYDPSGQLLSETRDGEHTDYVWLNGELLAVLSESGSYIVASDYVGAPQRLVTWTTGEIAWAADYEPFGRAQVYVPRSVDEPEVELNVRFPGQYYDEESGLHYNWHRYYDPGTGRYLQTDPMAMRIPGWRQGIFAYAMGNPLRWFDRRGLDVQNNSSEGVWVKPENDSDYVYVAPGETYYGEQDGVISQDGSIHKTTEGTHAVVNPDGSVDGFGEGAAGLIQDAGEALGGGPDWGPADPIPGPKGPGFPQRHPDWPAPPPAPDDPHAPDCK